MRVVASLSVKDEVELIDRSIAHLRGIGVDHIIAIDMESTDGTGEILERYSSGPGLWHTRMSNRESQEAWVRTNLELVNKANADWVIFLDADEFPIPATGSLKECAALDRADSVALKRFNIPLCGGRAAMPDALVPELYERLLLVVDTIADSEFWSYLEQNPDASWMRKQVMPRVIARPEKIESLILGAHDIVASDQASVRRATADDLLIAHLPFTTRRRFARKVENIRALLLVHDKLFGPHAAQHWRRWVELADQGVLDQEFDRMIFDAEETAELREQGVIRSAAELFRERRAVADT